MILAAALLAQLLSASEEIPQAIIMTAFNRHVDIVEYTPHGAGECTGVIIETGLVLTAAHCWENQLGTPYINGKPSVLVSMWPKEDLLLLAAETGNFPKIRMSTYTTGTVFGAYAIGRAKPGAVIFGSILPDKVPICTCVALGFAAARRGMSGGGVYDKTGALVGIVSVIHRKQFGRGYKPHALIAVNAPTIATFLERK